MIDQNEMYLAFTKLMVDQAINVLSTIIEDEIKQGYEETADLVRIQNLKEIWAELRYEIMPTLKDLI